MDDVRKILVVDDEETLRDVLIQLLEGEGHSVAAASGGEEALELFKRDRHDLIITDIRMPGMSGIELMKEVRSFDEDVPFIIITSHASLDTAVSAIRAGAYDYITRPFDDINVISSVVNRTLEKVRLVEENRMLIEDLRQKNDALEEVNLVLRDLSIRDALTGLYNHRYFQEVLMSEVVRSKRHMREFSLLFVDIDHFKHYNDTHGHPEGDRLLRTMADIFWQRVQQSDIVARYGGEEFVLVLPETPKTKGAEVAERILRDVANFEFPGAETQPLGKVTVSIGVSGFPDDGTDGSSLIKCADDALYTAKKNGRNRVEVC